jgi:hypothetical protein
MKRPTQLCIREIRKRNIAFTSFAKSETSRVGAVGIAIGYRLASREVGVRDSVGRRFVSSPRRPGRFCGPPKLLSNRYRGPFPGDKAAGELS